MNAELILAIIQAHLNLIAALLDDEENVTPEKVRALTIEKEPEDYFSREEGE